MSEIDWNRCVNEGAMLFFTSRRALFIRQKNRNKANITAFSLRLASAASKQFTPKSKRVKDCIWLLLEWRKSRFKGEKKPLGDDVGLLVLKEITIRCLSFPLLGLQSWFFVYIIILWNFVRSRTKLKNDTRNTLRERLRWITPFFTLCIKPAKSDKVKRFFISHS